MGGWTFVRSFVPCPIKTNRQSIYKFEFWPPEGSWWGAEDTREGRSFVRSSLRPVSVHLAGILCLSFPEVDIIMDSGCG